MAGRARIVGLGLLVAILGWPTLGASQARTTADVKAICLQEVKARIAHWRTSEQEAGVLRRAGPQCCEELSANADKLSPLQRGLVWARLDEDLAYKSRRPDLHTTRERISRLQGQLTLPQANAARGLIVDRVRCFRRAGEK